MELSLMLRPEWDRTRRRQVCAMAALLGYDAIVLPAGTTADEESRAAAAPAQVRTAEDRDGPGVVHSADPEAVRKARQAVGPGGWVVVDVPLAIGRTRAEAMARAQRDPGAAGAVTEGVFGALEDAQAQVRELVRAGADELRVMPADGLDIADLLAQARALVTGLEGY